MEMRRLSCALVDFFIFELVSVFGNRVTAGMSCFLSSLYTIQVQVQIQTNFSLRNQRGQRGGVKISELAEPSTARLLIHSTYQIYLGRC